MVSFLSLLLEEQANHVGLTKVLPKVLVVRLCYWLLMAVSCHVLPDFLPGDDVLQFDMRMDRNQDCFCIVGHACDVDWIDSTSKECAIRKSPSAASFRLWKFLLAPLTKWDAARFLHLAVNPQLRDPPSSCDNTPGSCDFTSSEQAHAFFPLFPILTRWTANFLLRIVPSALLLPTFEGIVVFSGLILNLLCLIIGSMALYQWLMVILPKTAAQQDRQYVATAAVLVYGIANPATVFFATNYSESLFSALTLLGHALFVQPRWWWAALPVWTASSYARSNGSIHALWLAQHLLAYLCYCVHNRHTLFSVSRILYMTILCVGAFCILLPIRHHDWHGYQRHCHEDLTVHPSWCAEGLTSKFSLYAWTQREHWDVGFFRYYQLKQIPNFLLAAPILGLGSLGVFGWIRNSLLDYGKGKLPNTLSMLLLGWPLHALAASNTRTTQPTFQNQNSSRQDCIDALATSPALLGHYAILAGLILVGLVIAHIQISTRLICSSSPAMLCFLTYCHLQDKNTNLRIFVQVYTLLYMVLGIILHVNFLPWT